MDNVIKTKYDDSILPIGQGVSDLSPMVMMMECVDTLFKNKQAIIRDAIDEKLFQVYVSPEDLKIRVHVEARPDGSEIWYVDGDEMIEFDVPEYTIDSDGFNVSITYKKLF